MNPLQVTYICCVAMVYSNVPLPIKCSTENPQFNTAKRASEICKDMNGSLLSNTKGLDDDMFYFFSLQEEYTEEELISIWTNQCVLKEGGYTKGVQYKFLPYEELTTCNFDNTSMLCILVGYNRKDLSIQWVAADCVEDKPKAKICCLVSQSRSTDNSFVHWIAKLFKEKATWGEAKDKCHKNNGELLLIPENEVRIDIGIIAGTREWFFNMEDVWINYKSNDEGQQLRPLSALYTLPDKTMEENISCVYLNANQATHPMPIMQWGIASCEYHYQFVCKIWTKTEEEFILEIPNATSTRPVLQTIDDGKQTPKTCLSRCRQMIINGYLCGGFNFHIENLSCQLFSGSLIPSGKQSIGISKSSMRNLFRIDLFRVIIDIPKSIVSNRTNYELVLASTQTLAGKIYTIVASIIEAIFASVVFISVIGEIRKQYVDQPNTTFSQEEEEDDLEFPEDECDDKSCTEFTGSNFNNIPPISVTIPRN